MSTARCAARYGQVVTSRAWCIDDSDGELYVRTGVTGRAARMGHRLTIAMNSWQATVRWSGDDPVAAELTVEVSSLQVMVGEGGVKALSGPEKGLARSNALKALEADRFPQITFAAQDIEKTSGGFLLTGTLDIHGQSRPRSIDLTVEDLGDSWQLSTEADVAQTDFGVKPYSMLMGSVKVADTVGVSFSATVAKP